MGKDLAYSAPSVFEQIKQTDEHGNEYWLARQIMRVLGYAEFRNFLPVIERAKEACENSGQRPEDHLVDIHEMVEIGSGAQRSMPSVKLSRYACYLIVQNADPAKEVVALGQTYFAVQTRLQEIWQMEAYHQLSSDEEKRLFLRNELKRHNSQLADAAKNAGVVEPMDYAIFQNHGYIGLYGGLDARAIHQKKKLKKSQHILDHMGSTELAANLFRATQTEDKLRRENITGKAKANQAHLEVGKKVRQTIQELGGTMPENLPAEGSITKLEQKQARLNLSNQPTHSLAVQPFAPQHTEAVVALILSIQIGEFQVPITRQDQPDLDMIPAFYHQGKGNFWVALHEGAVVGTIAAIDFGDDMLALRKMFVHPDFRGRAHGTAQMLLDTLLQWSQERQVRAILLGTIERFGAARKFYARNDFEELAKQDLPPNFPPMPLDTLFFRKKLAGEV